MPNMKFIVESDAHGREIQRALFRIGYKWSDGDDKVYDSGGKYLYAYERDKTITHGNNTNDFDTHQAVEYVYRLAMVEPRNGRPVQAVPAPVFDFHAHVADEIILDAKAPLGVKPRDIADRLHHVGRANELAEAITRFTNASKHVPVVWVHEYNERIEEIRKLEKTA